MNKRKALVIGIDDYRSDPLKGCVNDATDIASLLEFNEDGNRNFDVELLTDGTGDITNKGLFRAIGEFFKTPVPLEIAVLYFAGHGAVNPETDAGYILGADAGDGAPGMPLSHLIDLANAAYPNIPSTVIILDCCHSGLAGSSGSASKSASSTIGKGVTILTAAAATEKAAETDRHGVFTHLLIDALKGGAADVRGNITPAAVYSHIDQALGPKEQRPLYKANVHEFITLRNMKPKIPLEVLRRLPHYFVHPDMQYQLDPSYEPDRTYVSKEIQLLPVNPAHVAIFKHLQQYNRQGLLVPVGVEHMFDAAIQGKTCELTALGKHYRRLAETKKV